MPNTSIFLKEPCIHLIPLYHGERGIATRGEWKYSKDFTYECYSKPTNYDSYSKSYGNSVKELCDGCKKYLPLTKISLL